MLSRTCKGDIAQLEHSNALGLRCNWLSGLQLHGLLTSLFGKPGAPDTYSATDTGYFPNGDYQVYRYYDQNVPGYRVGTVASGDEVLISDATVDTTERTVRVWAGPGENPMYGTVHHHRLTLFFGAIHKRITADSVATANWERSTRLTPWAL